MKKTGELAFCTGGLPADDHSEMHAGSVTLVSATNNVLYNPDKIEFFLSC